MFINNSNHVESDAFVENQTLGKTKVYKNRCKLYLSHKGQHKDTHAILSLKETAVKVPFWLHCFLLLWSPPTCLKWEFIRFLFICFFIPHSLLRAYTSALIGRLLGHAPLYQH